MWCPICVLQCRVLVSKKTSVALPPLCKGVYHPGAPPPLGPLLFCLIFFVSSFALRLPPLPFGEFSAQPLRKPLYNSPFFFISWTPSLLQPARTFLSRFGCYGSHPPNNFLPFFPFRQPTHKTPRGNSVFGLVIFSLKPTLTFSDDTLLRILPALALSSYSC